jgi:alcohol dehydrogenase class IV
VRTEIAFDALAHAIETFLSVAATPATDVLAERACDELPGLLLELQIPASADQAIKRIALFAYLMGINLGNSSTCLPHRMQYAVAQLFDSRHQHDLLALYPAWLAALEREGIDRLARALRGIRELGLESHESHASDASALFSTFRQRLGLHPSLRDHGLTPSDAERLAALVTGNTAADPLNPRASDIANIFRAALNP